MGRDNSVENVLNIHWAEDSNNTIYAIHESIELGNKTG